MSNTVLSVQNLTKRYGRTESRRVTALRDVSLTLERGRIYGLVGNNGSGKTTLLRLIAGLARPTSGTLSLFGSTDSAGLLRARERLGTLIESPAYYGDLSIRQNLRAQALLLPKERRMDLDELCTLTGVTTQAVGRRAIRRCSLGQRQRYGIASALLGRPELLLLDEPLNGLDPSGVEELRELLLRLNRETGMTMLISSHILAELHKVATDYIFFDLGELIETVSAEALDARIAERGLKDVERYFMELTRGRSTW